jgi:putative (di)nucleoside polyphosphate hydrolase
VKPPAVYFRAGVGAVLLNGRGQVLVLERSDIHGAWQLPQGGLEPGEEPLDAVLREIQEETGISRERLRHLGRLQEPLAYVLPREARTPKTGMGQVQWWFCFRYLGSDSEIRLPEKGEFRRWAWQPFDEVLAGVVPFRRRVYEQVGSFIQRLLAEAGSG